jgi:uncharacterized repeat protein (TIGR01451 family)
MFRYLPIKVGVVRLLAGFLAGALLLQVITPIVVYGMEEALTPTNNEALPALVDVDTTLISTGDATAGATTETEVNTTETEVASIDDPVNEPATLEETAMVEATGPSMTSEGEPLEEIVPADSVAVTATNTATTITEVAVIADTGTNVGGGSDVEIVTGDAVAYADILTVVNTNIVDSDGLIDFINTTLGYQNFDLREDFQLIYADFDTAVSTSACDLQTCNDGSTIVTTTNEAIIDNTVTVTADTGSNLAGGDQAMIQTGDAYASANVITVANTNIVDSNYLLLVFNNFSSYAGDIILPSSTFFDQLLATPGGNIGTNTNIENNAVVSNSVHVVADTGNNEAFGGSTSVSTGDAAARSDVMNLVNQNIIGGTAFSMLIRVHGDWSGNIFGLPEGLSWRETDQGIEIFARDPDLGSVARNLSVSTKNTATVNNNVQVFALTGDNKAAGEEASITTGSAYADSSILNIVNTNVIGSNWSNLIFTIYGNWSGNLTFGQPDLWLGATAKSVDSPIMPDSSVTYTFTVFNRGDTTAPNVTLETLSQGDLITFKRNDGRESNAGTTKHQWLLGDIPAGATREFSYVAEVSGELQNDKITAIPLSSRVSSIQPDANDADNEDIVTVYVGEKQSKSSSRGTTFPAHFDITKTASRDLAQPGDTVDYTVTFFNRGGQLFDAMLVDTLENEGGDIVQQQSWPLGEIKNWETITINYSIGFDATMATGTYRNYAQLVGFHQSNKEHYQTPYESPVAKHELHLGTKPAGQVLGIQDCAPYLTTYMRFDTDNDPEEVRKLQQFLNDELGRSIEVSGIFDQATEQAVRDFQLVHREEVLIPWGLERDSGFVYYTTQKKINEIMCGGRQTFALDAVQQAEMQTYRKQFGGDPIPEFASREMVPAAPLPSPVVPSSVTAKTGREESVESNSRTMSQLFTPIESSPALPMELGLWGHVKSWLQKSLATPLSFLRW